jgi:hypothetical protein
MTRCKSKKVVWSSVSPAVQLTQPHRYIQAHALAYMLKLNIEMNLADLIGKVVKKGGQERTDFSDVRTWPTSPTREALKRELQQTLRRVRRPMCGHIRCGRARSADDREVEQEKGISCPAMAGAPCCRRRDHPVQSIDGHCPCRYKSAMDGAKCV